MTWTVIEAFVVLRAAALNADLIVVVAVRQAVDVVFLAVILTTSHFVAGVLNAILIDVVVTELVVVRVPWAVASVDAIGVTWTFLFAAVFGQFTCFETVFITVTTRFLAVVIPIFTEFVALLDFWFPENIAMAVFVRLHDGVVFAPNNSW